jgi:hypothetical protein
MAIATNDGDFSPNNQGEANERERRSLEIVMAIKLSILLAFYAIL